MPTLRYHGSLIHFSDGPLSFAKDSVASMAVVAEELPSCVAGLRS